jgi:hypothetical protein
MECLITDGPQVGRKLDCGLRLRHGRMCPNYNPNRDSCPQRLVWCRTVLRVLPRRFGRWAMRWVFSIIATNTFRLTLVEPHRIWQEQPYEALLAQGIVAECTVIAQPQTYPPAWPVVEKLS